jgi:hypothetical protein
MNASGTGRGGNRNTYLQAAASSLAASFDRYPFTVWLPKRVLLI